MIVTSCTPYFVLKLVEIPVIPLCGLNVAVGSSVYKLTSDVKGLFSGCPFLKALDNLIQTKKIYPLSRGSRVISKLEKILNIEEI